MPQIHFGFCLPADQLDPARLPHYVPDVRAALDLIADSFTGIWIIDHLQFEATPVLESFTTLAYMAALQPALQCGHMVLAQSFRNPALVAKMAATLQLLSGGRYVLGMGTGWHAEEYTAYGYPFPAAGVRVAQLDEALPIIRRLWTEPEVSFAGRHYQVSHAHCEPRPQPVPPVLVGAFKPQMLRVAARHADWWNVSSLGIGRYARLAAASEATCRAEGRDPATLRRTWGGGCLCAPTAARVQALTGTRYTTTDADFAFVGTPDQIVAQMRPFIELGVDYFILDCGGFPDLTTLDLLAHEVLPALNP